MKYLILETLFGWTKKAILLWSGLDWLMVISELIVIVTSIIDLFEKRKTTYFVTFMSEKRNTKLHLQYAW